MAVMNSTPPLSFSLPSLSLSLFLPPSLSLQECENLAKENALITGHHNLRQRIQYHAATKMENTKLKEVSTHTHTHTHTHVIHHPITVPQEVIHLRTQLRHRNGELDKMQRFLEKTDFSKPIARRPATHQSRIHSEPSAIKENIDPQ